MLNPISTLTDKTILKNLSDLGRELNFNKIPERLVTLENFNRWEHRAALHNAIQQRNDIPEAAKKTEFLMIRHPDTDATVYHALAEHKQWNIIHIPMSEKPSPEEFTHLKDNKGRNPLNLAAQVEASAYIPSRYRTLEAITEPDKRGNTALHYMVIHEFEVIPKKLKKPEYLLIQNLKSETPAHRLLKNKHIPWEIIPKELFKMISAEGLGTFDYNLNDVHLQNIIQTIPSGILTVDILIKKNKKGNSVFGNALSGKMFTNFADIPAKKWAKLFNATDIEKLIIEINKLDIPQTTLSEIIESLDEAIKIRKPLDKQIKKTQNALNQIPKNPLATIH